MTQTFFNGVNALFLWHHHHEVWKNQIFEHESKKCSNCRISNLFLRYTHLKYFKILLRTQVIWSHQITGPKKEIMTSSIKWAWGKQKVCFLKCSRWNFIPTKCRDNSTLLWDFMEDGGSRPILVLMISKSYG